MLCRAHTTWELRVDGAESGTVQPGNLAVFLLAFGAWIGVDLAHAEPSLAMADVSGGSVGGMALAMVAFVAGLVVIGYVKQHHRSDQWTAAGRAAGLEPSGTASPPELAGTVDGRQVRARIEKRTRSTGTEGTTRQNPYTIVQADLLRPADDGLIAGRSGERIEAPDTGRLELDAVVEHASAASELVAVEKQGLVVVGTSETAVKALAIGDALRGNEQLKLLAAGNARHVVTTFAEARNAEMEYLGSSIAEYPTANLVERFPADAGTVTIESQTVPERSDALGRTP